MWWWRAFAARRCRPPKPTPEPGEPVEKLSRRKARENAFIVLFSVCFGGSLMEALEEAEQTEEYALDDFARGLLALYENNAQSIDDEIEARLKGWNVKRLQKVNLTILRLAVAEMLYGQPEMDSVVINEAVELAKRYGDENDYQFVNGLLGTLSREKAAAKDPGAAEEAPV